VVDGMRLIAKTSIILAIAVAVIAYFFIHDYSPARGVVENMTAGRVYLTRECWHQVTFLPLEPKIPESMLQHDPVNHWWNCDITIPYMWILGAAVVVVAVALAVLY
jgi:hypothetical protein